MLCWFPTPRSAADQTGRYLLVIGKDNVVEQRKVAIGPLEGDLRVIDKGIKPDDRVIVAGILRAIPARRSIRTTAADRARRK